MSLTSASHRRHALALEVCLALASTPTLRAAETPAVEPYSANPYAAPTADHEPGHYAANLGRNLKGIFGRGNMRPLLSQAVLVGL